MEEHNKLNDVENAAPCCDEEIVHPEVISEVKDKMVNDYDLMNLSELFKVFGDFTRTKILSALFVEEMCVCDIAKLLGMTKSAISHQLRILRNTKLVRFRKQGKEVYYQLDDDHIARIFALGLEHIKHQ